MVNNLWMMGIQGGCLILLILAARWVLSRRNCPRSWCYGLWMLVGFRLLCPIFIESSGGIQPDLRKLWTQEQTEAGVSETTDGRLSRNSMETKDSVELGKSMAESGEQLSDLSSGQTRNHYDLLKLLRWAYGAGVCATAAVFFLQYVRLKKCVATAVREEKRIGMKEEVWLSEQISSPFVMGIFRHKIYLPYGLSEADRDCILKHERMHISHGDPVIRQIGLLAVCLHWWNPLVWYGFRKMCEDMEMTCDESVLKDARLEEKKIYAEALLRVAMNQSGFLEALYFGESHTEQRVRNLLSKKRENFFAFVLLSFFVAGCTQLFVTVGKDETQESPRENSGNMVEEDTENGPEETPLPDMSGYSLEQMPVELQDVILCNASVVSNKDPFRIQLVMTEGEYFTEEYAGAGRL